MELTAINRTAPNYEAACVALRRCVEVDEVVEWKNRAEAMQAYARQAKNTQMEADASKVRLRATRRLGELLAERKASGELVPGVKADFLDKAGVSRRLSAWSQRIASVPEAKFEKWLDERISRNKLPSVRACMSFANGILSDGRYQRSLEPNKNYITELARLKASWEQASHTARLGFLRWAYDDCAPQTKQTFLTWLENERND